MNGLWMIASSRRAATPGGRANHMRGQGDNRNTDTIFGWLRLSNGAGGRITIHLRHAAIHQDDVMRVPQSGADRFEAVFDRLDMRSQKGQCLDGDFAIDRAVVRDQDFSGWRIGSGPPRRCPAARLCRCFSPAATRRNSSSISERSNGRLIAASATPLAMTASAVASPNGVTATTMGLGRSIV